jgi:hypothetical protein
MKWRIYINREVKFVAWHNGILYFNLSLPFQISKKMIKIMIMEISLLGIQTESA